MPDSLPHAPLLRVEGLRRQFDDFDVFGELNFTLAPGRALALVGPNGSGKSTALRCITGADREATGTVELMGTPLDERLPQIRADLAVVMDDLDFFPDLSVVEHLDLFARAHRAPNADALVDAVLGDVGLTAQAAQLPGTLSSGQLRRLALASAFVRPRRLLVLDEPEQRLDTEGLAWLARRLNSDKLQGMSVLFASHNVDLVEAVADDVRTLAPSKR